MKTVDARGLDCPQPVMMTREALNEDASGVQVLVDSNCSVENISRFAKNSGYTVTVKTEGDGSALTLLPAGK